MTPIFDRALVRQRRARAKEDFLLRIMQERLQERQDALRHSVSASLHIGAEWQVRCSDAALHVIGDEECLPFKPESFDLVMICGSLHWVNDLPGALAQIRIALKPGGLFLAMFPGGETLHELRASLMQATLANEGGASPRVSPFVDVRDAGALLQRAGFELPVADVERLTVQYENPLRLMHDLRNMGEANALIERSRKPLRRATLNAATEYYSVHYEKDGRIPVTFDLIGMMGWKAK